jgi:Skp family chaperone for outer membrane proteins
MAFTALCVLSFAIFNSQACAQNSSFPQNGQRLSASTNIVLLDVPYIFKNYPRFKQMSEDFKNEVERIGTDFNRERDSLRKMAEKLDNFVKGSQDYKQLEEEIAKRDADLSVKVQLQKKTFLEREAKIYQTIYQEIEQEVNAYCVANNVDIVLKFNGEPVDINKPDSVLNNINRDVVWYSQNRNITLVILDSLNRRNGSASASRTNMPPQGQQQPNVNPFKR